MEAKKDTDTMSVPSQSARSPQHLLKCHLLALPRELRDLIYEQAFANNKVNICTMSLRSAGLVLASRQIHDETVALYYQHTTFRTLDIGSAIDWLVTLSPRSHPLSGELRMVDHGSVNAWKRRFTDDMEWKRRYPRPCTSGLEKLVERQRQRAVSRCAAGVSLKVYVVDENLGQTLWTLEIRTLSGGNGDAVWTWDAQYDQLGKCVTESGSITFTR